jgi:hypothetical protein
MLPRGKPPSIMSSSPLMPVGTLLSTSTINSGVAVSPFPNISHQRMFACNVSLDFRHFVFVISFLNQEATFLARSIKSE